MVIVIGVANAFITEYWTYTLVRFLLGANVGGMLVAGFVLVMEFIGTQHRATISGLFHVPFNLGYMLLPVFGYFLRDYTHFQIGISAPSIVLLTFICLTPESPLWLIAVKKTDEAIKIITKVAQM